MQGVELLQAVPVAVLTLDAQGRVTYANSAAEALLAESLPKLAGRSLFEFVHREGALAALLAKAAAENMPLHESAVELDGPRMGAHRASLHAVPQKDGGLLIACDAQPAPARLGGAEAAQASSKLLGHMAAVLAHEIKNPLSGIRGAAQLLEKGLGEADAALTRLICAEVERIRTLVEEVELFSSSAPLRTASVNIHEILLHAIGVVRHGEGGHVRFEERYDPSLPPVEGNRDLLVQACINLLKNACEAIGKQEDKTIVVTTSFASGLRYRPAEGGEARRLPVQVSIADNGPGIAPGISGRLFEPFATSKQSGKGLGLAIVAKIITGHGGIIEWDRAHHPGTCFRLMLPAAP